MKYLSSKEALARVREAEVEAAAIRARAAQKAAADMEKNEKACAARLTRATTAAESELTAKLAEVQKRADVLIEQSLDEARAATGDAEAEIRAHMRDAVKMIVWEMHNSCQ